MRYEEEGATLVSRDELGHCHHCGQCTSVCPSAKHGGIRPAEVMVRASLARIDPSDPVLWLCTMCNSCTERCQLGVGPAERIAEMRALAAFEGNVPKAFHEEARLFLRSGLSFPNTGLTRKARKELGLPELTMPEPALSELRTLVMVSTLGRLRLE